MNNQFFLLYILLVAASPCLAREVLVPVVDVVGNREEGTLESPFARDAQIDRMALEASTALDINDVLYGQPGLKIAQSKPGSGAGISLKGASGALGLLTLDGIPLFGNFVGYYALRNYPLDAVERIRVSSNAGLEMENNRTLGGVIQLDSRRLAPGKGMLQAEAGGTQAISGAAAVGVGTPLGETTLAAGWNQTFDGDSHAGPQNGGREQDNQRLGHVLVNIGKDFSRGNVFASAYYVRANDDIDGPALVPGPKVIWADDPNGRQIDATLVGQIRAQLQVTDQWQSTLQIGGTRNDQDGIAGLLRRSIHLDSRLWLAKWQNLHALPVDGTPFDNATLLWGVETQHQNGQSNATGKHLDKDLSSASLGISWDIAPLNFYAKVRRDHMDEGDHSPWSLGAAWHLAPETRIWGNVGRTFRVASVNEVLHPLFGNLNLKPEKGLGWDVGWAGKLSTTSSAQVNYYHQHYSNLIISVLDATTGVTRAGNLSDVVVSGLDVEMRQAWTPAWHTTLQYGHMRPENRAQHLDVPARPRNKLALQNHVQLSDKLDLNLDLVLHDGFWFDSRNASRAGSVVKLNGALQYAITPRWVAYLRAENLTDDDTVEVYGLGYAGRALYVGARCLW